MEYSLQDLFLGIADIRPVLQHSLVRAPHAVEDPHNAFVEGIHLELLSIYPHNHNEAGNQVWERLDRGEPRMVWKCLATAIEVVWVLDGVPAGLISDERLKSILDYNLVHHWRIYMEGQLRYAAHEERRLKTIIGLE